MKLLLIILYFLLVFELFIYSDQRFIVHGGFGEPIEEPRPNCGEYRVRLNESVKSKQDFIRVLKRYDGKLLDQYGNDWVILDDYKNSEGLINWTRVNQSVSVEENGALILKQQIYSLDYNPLACGGFTIRVTTNGEVSIKGCCGI